MITNNFPPKYKLNINENCNKCKRCAKECSFDVFTFDETENNIVAYNKNCVACRRCVLTCPQNAIELSENKIAFNSHFNWDYKTQNDIHKQSDTGAKLLTSVGTGLSHKNIFDHLLLDACQVTNPSIDPLREPMELRTFVGRKSDNISDEIGPQLQLETPIVFAAMSFGALSLNVHKALGNAARKAGTCMNCGEGGLHPDMVEYGPNTFVQVASGRFGIDKEYLESGAAIEIKIGQGAKPGIGGHLPGEKIDKEISKTRMIPEGSDAISPAPHHDIYSIEDLENLIYLLKEVTEYKKPVGVKISAVHNAPAIATGIVRAGADFVAVDGLKGGTGATPATIRDNVGIPIELAISSIDKRLREEKIRHKASIIASGGIRSSADILKIIALGADCASIGTAALIALGCTVCESCHTNKCAWGIATQKPELTKRLDPEEGGERVYNLLRSWSLEMKELLGSLGITSIESLKGNRERLRALDLDSYTMETLGVKGAGR
ncbi:glutamate synthase-related protein [Natranaerofaba carboxydovora]|uniref:glutamate synthase-related protein n=1 Tax=Natranaerofaba carboxydovora TaxID=2742683 RepID=UPI003B847408|nr:Glutamate synthase [NADPH] large chain [Natranaerofaba carboxydovora]